jgi:hypothetical protein
MQDTENSLYDTLMKRLTLTLLLTILGFSGFSAPSDIQPAAAQTSVSAAANTSAPCLGKHHKHHHKHHKHLKK